MEAVTGTVSCYCRATGKGWIALDNGEDCVQVDLISSRGIWLRKGLRVRLGRINRREGVFAVNITLI
ncbi:cold-shock protein [Pseudomonas sp. SDO5271_S396]